MSTARPAVAVVGGGIAGLTVAYRLASAPEPPDVIVLEAAGRLGGKIRTDEFAGQPVEAGPDAVLARVPWAVDLVHELGLDGDVVHPATGKARVWARGRLRPLPDGLVLGVPGRLGPLLRSGILSPAGVARAGLDLVLPRREASDPSVADVIGGRFGPEVLDRLVDPMISGINAGRADRLSLRAAAPDVAAAAESSRSLLLGLRARARRTAAPGAAPPVFLSLRGGLGRLVERLSARIRELGVEVRTGTRVSGLARDGNVYRVALAGDGAIGAGAVVLAVPAFAAAPLVDPLSPAAAGELRGIPYSSVALATVAYPEDAAGRLDGSGFLVPRSHGWLLTAGTFVSTKWPALRPPGLVLVRASCGRAGDDRPAGLDDEALVATLHGEVARATGIGAEPVAWRVDRWPDSFPQYEPGHQDRVGRIEAALAGDCPGIVVTGAAYRGVGIASCVRYAADAAASARAAVATV